MAITTSRITYDADGSIVLPDDHGLPDHTVDALLKAGDAEGARAKLERLCLEGLDSGEPVRMTAEKWEEFRLDLHRRAKVTS